jgi:hypothetical protein
MLGKLKRIHTHTHTYAYTYLYEVGKKGEQHRERSDKKGGQPDSQASKHARGNLSM